MPDKTNIILEDRVTSLEEKIFVLNTESTTLRSFVIEQLLLSKQWRKKNQRIHVTQTSSVMKQNICEKKATPKTVLFKRYFKNRFRILQKNIQNTPDSRTLDISSNKPKSTNHFILPKKSSSNIKSPSCNQIATSNSFDLLSENTENSLDANNVISIEDNSAESYSNKRPSNTSISTEKKVNFRHNRKKQE